jgi:hypothetical protein
MAISFFLNGSDNHQNSRLAPETKKMVINIYIEDFCFEQKKNFQVETLLKLMFFS